MVNNRSDIIKELVRTEKIRSQEEFIGLLAARGVHTTQATLSRDLRKLHISKQHDAAGQYRYVLLEPSQSGLAQSRAGESIVSLCFSGQMGVIKTQPGCANMVGALIDGHEHPALMGTIAGDDTLLLILRENAVHKGFLAFLEELIPGIGNKLKQ